MIRSIAIILLFIPGVIAAIGIKFMRDTLFNDFYPIFFYPWIQFVVGLVLFIGGLVFLGGFVIYRDRKNKKKEREEKLKKSLNNKDEELKDRD